MTMSEPYKDGDILYTKDGNRHRYLWWNRDRTQIFVKPASKSGKAYLIRPQNIIMVERHVRT